MGRRKVTRKSETGSSANLGFEQTLWQAADKLRGHMDASECKHIGPSFLKYIPVAFDELHTRLVAEADSGADPEERDEYTAENVFSGCPRQRAGLRFRRRRSRPRSASCSTTR